MANRGRLTRILAIAGTVLAWFPIAAPFLLGAFSLIRWGRFMFDFLMPAELFPVFLAGALLLLWAALRARAWRGVIAWGLGAAIVLLVGTQGLATLTGLASGEAEATGWRFALVISVFAGSCLAMVAVAVGGTLLLRDLYRPPSTTVTAP